MTQAAYTSVYSLRTPVTATGPIDPASNPTPPINKDKP
jgi:hypothetical protein